MNRCNDTVTVFNARYNPDNDCDEYIGTVINGVSWFCRIASTVDSSGLRGANVFTIRIPADADFSGKQYADAVMYAKGDPATLFTLKSGDVIVKGITPTSGLRPADLQKYYPEVATILGVTDNSKAAHAPHWKVVGK